MASRRERWSADLASSVLDEFEASGLTMAEFGRRKGIHPDRIRSWRVRLGRVSSPLGGPRLVELVSSPIRTSAEVETRVRVQVYCPTGHRVDVTDVELDAGLRAALTAVAGLARAIEVSGC